MFQRTGYRTKIVDSNGFTTRTPYTHVLRADGKRNCEAQIMRGISSSSFVLFILEVCSVFQHFLPFLEQRAGYFCSTYGQKYAKHITIRTNSSHPRSAHTPQEMEKVPIPQSS